VSYTHYSFFNLLFMERKEFLSLLGLGSAAVFTAVCMVGCSKEAATQGGTAPTNVDFTLDLTLPANANLVAKGGYIYSNGIIVALTAAGNYIAVSQACTHEGVSVQYVSSQDLFYCPSHGAKFSDTGTVISGPTSSALKQYNTSLNGTSLRVYS
jgi:cytochrome b6-f complex iron-sulfur subunit